MKTLLVAVLALCISTFAASKKSTKHFDYSNYLLAKGFTHVKANNIYINMIEYVKNNFDNAIDGYMKFKSASIINNSLYITEYSTSEIEMKGQRELVEMYNNGQEEEVTEDMKIENSSTFILIKNGIYTTIDKNIRDQITYVCVIGELAKTFTKNEFEDSTTYTKITENDTTISYGNKKFEANFILSHFIDNNTPPLSVDQTAINCNEKSLLLYKSNSYTRKGSIEKEIKSKVRNISDSDYEDQILEVCKNFGKMH